MDIQVREINRQLICIKQDHNEPIIMVIMEDNCQIQERFLCVKCLKINRAIVRMLGLEQVQEMIQQIKDKQKEANQQQISNDISILKDFQFKMQQLSTQMIRNIEETLKITQLWINELEIKNGSKELMNLINGLQLLDQKKQQECFNKQINNAFIQQLDKIIQRLINNEISKAYDLLKVNTQCDQSIKQKPDKVENNDQKLSSDLQVKEEDLRQNICRIQLINTVKQEACYSIAFNASRSLMITGGDKNIKVWRFDKGQMIELKRLIGHLGLVSCLAFSKQHNWFASGSCDKTVRCWKEQANGDWVSNQQGQQHTDWIKCILINKNENELITCSQDKTIVVWKIEYLSNQLSYNYTLDLKHNGWVYSISMNESETYLVSCSSDKNIILWNKDNQNKWTYLNQIIKYNEGSRLCFISDDQFIWQQNKNGLNHIFEIQNKQIIEKSDQNLQLNKEIKDHDFFPTIFNKKRNIILQSHNQYVYFLKKQKNQKLNLVTDPIDCLDKGNWGSWTDDGEYLIVWNFGTKELRVHQIHFS